MLLYDWPDSLIGFYMQISFFVARKSCKAYGQTYLAYDVSVVFLDSFRQVDQRRELSGRSSAWKFLSLPEVVTEARTEVND